MKCVYCELPEVKTREVARNNWAWAFPTNIPIVPGHVLVCPIRCVSEFSKLSVEEKLAMFDLSEKLKNVLREVFGAEGFNQAWNEGAVAGQAVSHLHLHIVPRKKGDTGITEYDPRKFLYRPGSREKTPEAELKRVADLISVEFKKL